MVLSGGGAGCGGRILYGIVGAGEASEVVRAGLFGDSRRPCRGSGDGRPRRGRSAERATPMGVVASCGFGCGTRAVAKGPAIESMKEQEPARRPRARMGTLVAKAIEHQAVRCQRWRLAGAGSPCVPASGREFRAV